MTQRTAILTVILTILLASVSCARVTVERISYHGWGDSYRLSNGSVSLVVVPDIGGRIMEFSLDGENVLWQNTEEFGRTYPLTSDTHNYGGYKVWLSPEDRWVASKDPIIDYGKANVEVLQSAKGYPIIKLIGGPSLASGALIIREITMDDSGMVAVKQTLRNIGNKHIDFGIWDVTQVETPSLIAFPVNAKSRFPGGIHYIVAESKNSRQFDVREGIGIVNYAGEFGKIGADSNGPWVINFKDNLAYVKLFGPMTKGSEYPDGGCSVEVFTADSKQDYMEMEILSPITTLNPGGQTSMTERWLLVKLGMPVKDEKGVVKAVKGMQGKGWIP